MLKLFYTGYKLEINQHGVFFNTGKHDKYLYLPIAVNILTLLDKAHETTVVINRMEKLSDAAILEMIRRYEPELETHVKAEEKAYERHIAEMIALVRDKERLSEIEKSTWIRNIEIMRPYMIQREINKLYYIHTLKHIKETIYTKRITEIQIDFDMMKWHVMRSIAGNLSYGVKSVSTQITVEPNREGKKMVKLLTGIR